MRSLNVSKTNLIIILSLIASLLSSCASFSASDKIYQDAIQFAKEGRRDFVFMSLNELLREDPNYRYAAKAKFSIAEYYFLNGNYRNAINEFSNLIRDYKDPKIIIFVKVFLYKIITDPKWAQDKEALVVGEQIKQEFFSRSAFFIFSEFKTTKLKSLLGNTYLLKEYVDKIEILQNDKIFFSVSR
jgi:tetratricopeptide (TPR) repeat protein